MDTTGIPTPSPEPDAKRQSYGSFLGDIADNYHVASRNSAAQKHVLVGHRLNYDDYVQELVRDAPLRLDGARVSLPEDRPGAAMSVEQAVRSRISGRAFAPEPLTVAALTKLLVLGSAVRRMAPQQEEAGFGYRRNTPNSGNLGSVEVFPIVLSVDRVDPGIYHFDSLSHDLVMIRRGYFASWLQRDVFFQEEWADAAVALVLTVAIGRLKAKYGIRGYRLGFLDVGHVSENLYLVATALGLEVCATAGFIDDELDLALGLDGLDTVTALVILVGTKATLAPDPSFLTEPLVGR
jgi:SagB-type dehydrogenase family enzyme